MKNQLSPQKYIATKARMLPFHECYVNEDWQESGMANIYISKKMPGGNFIIGLFLVDIYCLGLKNTFYQFNLSSVESKDLLKKFIEHYDSKLPPCDIALAHNIIYGGIDYAEEIGFKPHKDFGLTEFLLNPDLIDDGIDEIEFGKDDKPFFINGPDDNVARVLGVLNRTVGEGNYLFMEMDGPEDDDYEEDDEE